MIIFIVIPFTISNVILHSRYQGKFQRISLSSDASVLVASGNSTMMRSSTQYLTNITNSYTSDAKVSKQGNVAAFCLRDQDQVKILKVNSNGKYSTFQTLNTRCQSIALSKDGTYLVVVRFIYKIYKLNTTSNMYVQIKVVQKSQFRSKISSLHLSQNGELVVGCHQGGQMVVIDQINTQKFRIRQNLNIGKACALKPDGKYVFYYNKDKQAIFKINLQQKDINKINAVSFVYQKQTQPDIEVQFISISPDQKYIAFVDKQVYVLRNKDNQYLLQTISPVPVLGLSLSNDIMATSQTKDFGTFVYLNKIVPCVQLPDQSCQQVCPQGYRQFKNTCENCYGLCPPCNQLTINQCCHTTCSSCVCSNILLPDYFSCNNLNASFGQSSCCHVACRTCLVNNTIDQCSTCPQSHLLRGNKCCHPSCLTCLSQYKNQCLSCISGLKLRSQYCCHTSCQKCTGPTNIECTQCSSPLILKETTCCHQVCTNSCFGIQQQKCCHQSCNLCSGPTRYDCLNCKNDLKLRQYSCCYQDCATCSGTKKDQCLSCYLPFVLSDGKCQIRNTSIAKQVDVLRELTKVFIGLSSTCLIGVFTIFCYLGYQCCKSRQSSYRQKNQNDQNRPEQINSIQNLR